MRRARALVAAVLLAGSAVGGRTALASQDAVRDALGRAGELIVGGEYEAALDVLREVDDDHTPRSLRPYVQVRISELERALGRSGPALETLRRADAVLGASEPELVLRSYLLSVRAQTYLDLGLIDMAARNADLAHELLSGLEAKEDPPLADGERIQVDYVRVTLAASREDYLELADLVEEALLQPVYARHPDRAALLIARLGLGLKEAARMDPTLAERASATLEEALANEAIPPIERVLPELALGELALREGRFTDCDAWVERASEHLATGGARERLPQYRAWLALVARLAYERDDRAATREGRESLRASLANTLDAGLEAWREREMRPGGYGFLQYADERSLLSEWIRLELELSGEELGARNALERVVRAGDASTLARRLNAEPASLERALVEVLGPADEHVLLAFLPAPDCSHVFVADRERVRHVVLTHSDAIQEARLAATRALESVQRAEPSAAAQRAWRTALDELAELLLPAEMQGAMGARKRVTILGRDLLGDLPFEALPLESGDWFGCARALSHVPSLAVGRVLAARTAREARPRASDEGVSCLLLAAPEATQLALGAAEAREMLAPWPSSARRVACGRAATARALREGSANAWVAELFTHGARDPALERPMTFVLDDGEGSAVRLGADEVETLDAPPLVVLAVCRSGSGPKRRGDASAAELAGSFFLAGPRVRCVIASAFDLEAEATRRLSRALHAGLVAGLAPDEALRAARVELASDERFVNPRFHCLLSAVGAAQAPLVRP